MKRALILILIVGACVAGFLSIRGVTPFLPVFGTSMEPELQAGNLIMIEEVSPSEVEVGDIIVFSVPEAVREYYNYPPLVAHRVIKVSTEHGMTFRTKGDNTGEDPFTVRAQDIRGKVGQQIPYLGFPLLFLQSRQGLIFIIVTLSLLALYLYGNELGRGRGKIQRGFLGPVIEETRRSRRLTEQMIEGTEKGMIGTQQALQGFTSAISEYAEHLKSHTSAIQGMSDASQELKKSATEQNKVLGDLVKVIEQPPPRVEPRVEQVIVKEKGPPSVTRTIAQAQRPPSVEQVIVEIQVVPRVEQVVVKEQTPPVIEEAIPEAKKYPPGCIRSRRQPTEEEADKEDIAKVSKYL